MDKNHFWEFLRIFIGWPISIVAIFFLIKLFLPNLNQILEKIRTPDIFILIISVVCLTTFYFLRSYLWKMLLKEKGYAIPLKDTAFLWGMSELKRFAPGNIWSFLGKFSVFSKKDVDKKTLGYLILFEAEFFVFGCLIISAFSIPFILKYVLSIKQNLILITSVLGVLIFLVSLIFIFNQKVKKWKFLPDFPPSTNLSLLFISILALSFFGMGTYFAIASISSLNPASIVWFASFFVFSILIGYISFVTPMGLGIREAVLTIGLSKFLTLSLAVVLAIYARIILIISEIVFLILAYLWKNVKIKVFLKVENFIKSHPHETILAILVLVYITYFTCASFLRYDNFYTGRFDLGNMDQTVWNTIHGRIFQITDPNGTNIISRLAFHADFILVLISPLYLIWSNPKMLLMLQSVILGAGAVFIYLLSWEILKNKKLSLVFSFAFLITPSIGYANLYDFHPVVFATTFLLATFYFLKRKNYFWFVVFLLLSALTKEQIWIIAALFGLYVIFIKKKKLLGGALAISSVLIFYYLIWHAIPSALGGQHFALAYYSDFGDSPTSVIKNIIFSPQKTFSVILQKNQLLYLLDIFLPLGFLSLLNPLPLIFAVPDLMLNLLSKNATLHEIYYQYSSSITPFIFISAIYGMSNLKNKVPKINVNACVFFIFFFSFLSSIILGPLPGSLKPNIDMFTKPQPDRKTIDDFLSSIPGKFSIAATNNLGSHLSHREAIYTIPVGMNKADIILFLLNDPFAQPSLNAQKQFAKQMEHDKNYIEVFKKDDFIVFEKRNLYLEKGRKKINKVELFPLSIPTLESRHYDDGEIKIERRVSSSKLFSSYIISYPADGLKIYALMNIPNLKKPKNGFPVVIINHGYINPKEYSTITSYKAITDYFASHGYLVIKPDYRGNGKSELDNQALMRFAYPIDVMNLIASLKNIIDADSGNIYLWGHSMGGEVALEVLEIAGKNPDFSAKIKAAVLWAPVTDPVRWFSRSHVSSLEEATITPFPYTKTFQILGTPDRNPKLWQSLSPLNYLSNIRTPIQIDQGTLDETVPYSWSIELYNDLESINKNAELHLYPNNNHNIIQSWREASKNSLDFFKNH